MSKNQERIYNEREVCVFRKTKDLHGGLSNMASGFPLTINGVRILSSEALYQACRFPHIPSVQEKIISEKSPMTAKMVGKPFRENTRQDWEKIRVNVMEWCLRVKLAQNFMKFGKLLESTKDKSIVEDSLKDPFWGAVRSKEDSTILIGVNALGRLLMKLRQDYYTLEKSELLYVQPLDIPNFLLLGKPILTVDERITNIVKPAVKPNQESLYALILALKKETNAITMNPCLDEIDLNKIKEFEIVAQYNPFYKNRLKIVRDNLKKTDYIFSGRHKAALDAYNELVIFEYLNAKIETQFVQEIKDVKTPDYKLTLNENESTYCDLKTLHYVDGNNNYIDIQNQSAEVKMKHEKEINKRERAVTFSDPIIISPFKRGNNESHYNIHQVIEDIIDKSSNLLKKEQINYDGKTGIYIIDTSHIGLQSDLKLGLPVHEGYQYKELISGILWNAVFGRIGDPTYNYVEWEGKPNLGQRLSKNGILNDDAFKELKAVVFIMTSYSENEKKSIGFYRSKENTNQYFMKILFRIADFVNDETNSQYWRLINESREDTNA